MDGARDVPNTWIYRLLYQDTSGRMLRSGLLGAGVEHTEDDTLVVALMKSQEQDCHFHTRSLLHAVVICRDCRPASRYAPRHASALPVPPRHAAHERSRPCASGERRAGGRTDRACTPGNVALSLCTREYPGELERAALVHKAVAGMSDADADMVSNKDDMLADTPTIPKEDELASIPKEDELASSAPADAQALMDATADNDEGLKKHGKVGSDSDTDGPPPEGRRGARRTGFGTEPGPTGREEASRPATALTPQELLDKVARAKSFARHQLFELTRQHREAEMRLRQLDAGARVRASDERELNQTGSKRGRDDPLSPEGGEHARKERRHSESAKEESRDGDGGSAHKEGGSALASDRASKVAADSDAEGRERGGDGGNVAMRVDVAEAVGAPSDGATPGSAGADRPGRRPPPPPLRMSPSPRVSIEIRNRRPRCCC
eukprot:5174986-Pleurochrysis_carterae.AAC.3